MDRNSERPSGIAGLRYDVARIFLTPARAQYKALMTRMSQERTPFDAIVVDPTFIGALLVSGHPRHAHPPVIVAGMLTLPLSSSAVPPFGLGMRPWRGPTNHVRNTILRALGEKWIFAPAQAELDTLYHGIHDRDAPAFVVNG